VRDRERISMQADLIEDGRCVVVDFKTRRRVGVPAVWEVDKRAGDRIYVELARVLERGLTTLSATAVDRAHLEAALRAARSRADHADTS
jgi:hypothetical protein